MFKGESFPQLVIEAELPELVGDKLQFGDMIGLEVWNV